MQADKEVGEESDTEAKTQLEEDVGEREKRERREGVTGFWSRGSHDGKQWFDSGHGKAP
jgi:hypothetical protein